LSLYYTRFSKCRCLVSLTRKRVIYLALELDRTWTESFTFQLFSINSRKCTRPTESPATNAVGTSERATVSGSVTGTSKGVNSRTSELGRVGGRWGIPRQLLVSALAILPDCQLRAKAREALQRVVPERCAQAEKCHRDQKARHFIRGLASSLGRPGRA